MFNNQLKNEYLLSSKHLLGLVTLNRARQMKHQRYAQQVIGLNRHTAARKEIGLHFSMRSYLNSACQTHLVSKGSFLENKTPDFCILFKLPQKTAIFYSERNLFVVKEYTRILEHRGLSGVGTPISPKLAPTRDPFPLGNSKNFL